MKLTLVGSLLTVHESLHPGDLQKFLEAEGAPLNRIKDISFAKLGLTQLPDDLSALSNLRGVELDNNLFNRLPNVLLKLSLTHLSLRDNGLENVASFQGLESLRSLTLSKNRITNITMLCALTSLTELDLSNNEIRNLPFEIKNLFNLQLFYLASNNLEDLPELPQSLQYLHLTKNELTVIPYHLATLPHLKLLNVKSNKLTKFLKPPDPLNDDCEPSSPFPALDSLDLSKNQIQDLSSVLKAKELKTLNLSENKIAEVPEGITALSKLVFLLLGGNKLNAVPVALGSMRNLHKIDLRGNNDLTSFPEAVMQILRTPPNPGYSMRVCTIGNQNLTISVCSTGHWIITSHHPEDE